MGEDLEPDAALIRLVRGLVAYLLGEGIPDPDVTGAARVGVILAAIAAGRGAVARALRDRLAEIMPVAPPPGGSAFIRYVQWAGPRLGMFLVVWGQVVEAHPADDDDGVLHRLCRALTRIEGERLVSALER